ncbi:hypothetical protein TWF569_004922 [Orbilia oligospora]|uniref:Roadblock/LAMTOR2 domain-containing protein n=1 Tax=Orbilia oligospora TaxID=2813651 RepID=A0A7C8PKZ3_ORBOL|nr:hypothetical protein TWF102_008434 [Orbilia oligospora]KAF3109564.1 hypothetical protein TWF706_001428 [Orbilia oligospora]KAF3114712.1 hypothetical protein TWF103_000449 [Orbilia oligospora]KAF3119194.1 hypothetical protein TWF703_003584 [Orbilia oligospora]KAF3122960.1 hypothetical protein TWF594_002575 [Orbilia oligospora]
MLKTKPLNALLSQSLSEHVSSVILFTPSGNLLASSAPPNSTDAKKARVHAALAANIWSTYERVATDGLLKKAIPSVPQDAVPTPSTSSGRVPTNVAASSSSSSNSKSGSSGGQDHVKTLTVELTEYNLHIQLVSPRMLLGMIGKQGTGHPSSSSSQHSNEGSDHDPGAGSSRGVGPSLRPGPGAGGPTSAAGSGGLSSGGAMGVLKVTAQTLVDYLKKELKDFEPPEDL